MCFSFFESAVSARLICEGGTRSSRSFISVCSASNSRKV